MRTNPINTTQFKAIKVKHIKPVLKHENVTFYNNATVMLDKPTNPFDGANQFMEAIYSSLHKHFYTAFDEFDISRLLEMIKNLPKTFASRTLLGIIGGGLNNTALLLDNNDVLCLSDNMDVFKTRDFEEFDLPIKSSGNYSEQPNSGWYIREFGAPISKTELEQLGRKIKAKGYELDDWRTEQGCRIGNELYLLDFECAVKPKSR